MAANTEVVTRKEGYIRWKSDLTGATAQTVGYALGGITVSITRYRQEVRNNDGTFSHWKITKDPDVDIKVSKLYQDSASDMLQSGIVLGTTITAGGSAYTTATVAFSAPQMPGGVTATGTVNLSGGAVTSITLTNPGSGYTSAPTPTISGNGTGATATATVSPIGFLAAVSGQTTPSGKLSIEMIKADGTLDIIRVSKATIVSNNKNQADGGDTHELSFKAIGEPDYTQTATLN